MTITIKSLASSSSGNAYRISDGFSPLLAEAGIPLKKIKTGLNFRLSDIEGCLITHEHSDHSGAILDVLKAGVDCLMSIGTAKALGVLLERRVYTCKATVQVDFHGWLVVPFSAIHDCAEPLGFLLQSKQTGEKLFFATDTAYIPARFRDLNYIMVECNYDRDTIEKNIRAGNLSMAQYARITASHFGLQNVVEFLKANDMSTVKEIHLMHLSDGNSDEELMVKTVQRLAGCPVYACKK